MWQKCNVNEFCCNLHYYVNNCYEIMHVIRFVSDDQGLGFDWSVETCFTTHEPVNTSSLAEWNAELYTNGEWKIQDFWPVFVLSRKRYALSSCVIADDLEWLLEVLFRSTKPLHGQYLENYCPCHLLRSLQLKDWWFLISVQMNSVSQSVKVVVLYCIVMACYRCRWSIQYFKLKECLMSFVIT